MNKPKPILKKATPATPVASATPKNLVLTRYGISGVNNSKRLRELISQGYTVEIGKITPLEAEWILDRDLPFIGDLCVPDDLWAKLTEKCNQILAAEWTAFKQKYPLSIEIQQGEFIEETITLALDLPETVSPRVLDHGTIIKPLTPWENVFDRDGDPIGTRRQVVEYTGTLRDGAWHYNATVVEQFSPVPGGGHSSSQDADWGPFSGGIFSDD